MRTRFFVLILLALPACFSGGGDVTESGKGRPQLTISAPETAAAGDVISVELSVTNPGPEDMKEVVVVFARLGDPDLPYPIVEGLPGKRAEGVVDVEPAPTTRSEDGITYRFPGLDEGESTTITFDLRIPEQDGFVGNSIQVYDSADAERARGVGLKVQVEEGT